MSERLLRRCLALFEALFDDCVCSQHLLDIMTFILRNRFYLYYDEGSKKDVGRRLLTRARWAQIERIAEFLRHSKNPAELRSFFEWLGALMDSFLRRGGKNRKQKFDFVVCLDGPAWQALPRGFLPYFDREVASGDRDCAALSSFLRLFLRFDSLCSDLFCGKS